MNLLRHGVHVLVVVVIAIAGAGSQRATAAAVDEDDVKAYIDALSSKDVPLEKKIIACKALAKLGPDAKSAVPTLIDALAWDKVAIMQVARGYKQFTDPPQPLMVSEDFGTLYRIAALRALQAIEAQPASILPALEGIFKRLPKDADAMGGRKPYDGYIVPGGGNDVAAAAAAADSPVETAKPIQLFMCYSQPELCRTALELIGKCGKVAAERKELVDLVTAVARGSLQVGKSSGAEKAPVLVIGDNTVRIAAIDALGAMEATGALPALRPMATELESDQTVRDAARKARDKLRDLAGKDAAKEK